SVNGLRSPPAELVPAASPPDRGAQRLQLVADIGDLLAASEPEAGLPQFAARAVPLLGDWCAIDVTGPSGTLRRVADAAVPEHRQLFTAFDQAYAALASPTWGARHVGRTGVA